MKKFLKRLEILRKTGGLLKMNKIERLKEWEQQLREAYKDKEWKRVCYVTGNIRYILNQGGKF